MDAALPPIDVPPYYRPITLEALAARAGAELPPDFHTVAPGWTLAEFTITGEFAGLAARVERFGWVKGAFAVSVEIVDGEPLGNLTHLPSGYGIHHVVPKEHTATVAEIIAPLCDWETLRPSQAPGINLARTLNKAGFERCFLPTHERGLLPVLVRTGLLQ